MRAGEAVGIAVVVGLAALGVVLLFAIDPSVAGSAPQERVGNEREAALLIALEAEFGSWAAPQVPADLPLTEPDFARGARVWLSQCAQCHGTTGAADTPTAALHKPRPRDLRHGIVKYKSSERGYPPLRTDLEDTLRLGIAGTGMSAFRGLPEPDLQAALDWTTYVMLRGQTWTRATAALAEAPQAAPADVLAAELETVRTLWNAAPGQGIVVPPRPAPDAAAAERGATLFRGKAQCATCHSDDGSGLPDGALPLIDSWGWDVEPRDLRGGWRGSRDAADLFRRVRVGIDGTPMPGVGDTLTDDEVWDVVAFLEALAE
jgi:mono/diheme cytochrome c family protein